MAWSSVLLKYISWVVHWLQSFPQYLFVNRSGHRMRILVPSSLMDPKTIKLLPRNFTVFVVYFGVYIWIVVACYFLWYQPSFNFCTTNFLISRNSLVIFHKYTVSQTIIATNIIIKWIWKLYVKWNVYHFDFWVTCILKM